MKPEQVFQAIKELSEPFIENYHNDLLVHDKRAVECNHKNTPFVHFTGTLGTYLFFFSPADEYPPKGNKIKYLFGQADRYHILDQVLSSIRWVRTSNRQCLILHYDGNRLYKITQDIAESLADAYVTEMRLNWDKEEWEEAAVSMSKIYDEIIREK